MSLRDEERASPFIRADLREQKKRKKKQQRMMIKRERASSKR